jgi:hypothetical protein
MSRTFIQSFLVTAVACGVALCSPAKDSHQSRYNEPYPNAISKKGLQVELVDDALALGVKHAALNVNLTGLYSRETNAATTVNYEFDGETFCFRRAYLEQMDTQLKQLSDKGVIVNMIVLAYASGNAAVDRVMLHPNYATNAPNHLGAFNNVTPEGRRWFSACMEFLAERWSRPDQLFGRASGYIIGNEVNSHWWWSNMGRVTMEEFADDYLRTVRIAHKAIRKQSSWARVYLSLEHHWNIRYGAGDERQSFPARAFLDYFNKRAKEQGDFDWHIAFHPYPEDLFKPDFWNDKTATTNTDTKRITFQNLEMLTDYLRQPEMLFSGHQRRVILSEQGFHTQNGLDGERLQAEAYCRAYKKVDAMQGIDSFILHRHVDHDAEGGLLLGLRGNKPSNGEARPRKMIYECFRAADTAQWRNVFNSVTQSNTWPLTDQFVVLNISTTPPADVFKQIAQNITQQTNTSVHVGIGAIFSYLRYPPEKVRADLEEFLRLAESHNIPIVIQLDGESWWEARPDLWNWWDASKPGFNPTNRLNVEWSGWQPEDAIRIAWRNWGQVLRVLPPPNLMSPSYRNACHVEMEKLVPVVLEWWRGLPEEKRWLLIGLKVGWESSIGVNAWYFPDGNKLADLPTTNDPTNKLKGSEVPSRGMATLGYAAVKTSGIRAEGEITEADLAEVVRLHLEDLSRVAAKLGLPREKLFTHVGGWKEGELLYSAATNQFSCPGWSFYRHANDPRADTGVQSVLAASDAPGWAAVEWLYRGKNDVEGWTQALENAFADSRCRFVCIYNWENVRENKIAMEAIRQVTLRSQSETK